MSTLSPREGQSSEFRQNSFESKGEYGVYNVEQKEKRSIIDPFDRRAINY
jgi:hypothetical protein